MAAAEKIIDTIENAQEIVEETLDVLEGVPAWRCGLSRKQHAAQLIALGVVAAAVGGVVAFHFGRKRMKSKYEAISKKEIEEAKEFYRTLHKKDEYDSPDKVVEDRHPELTVVRDAADAIRRYQGESPTLSMTDELEDVDDDDLEIRAGEETPYIITQDEFLRADPGFEQQVLTYYVGDDTLADQSDNVIDLPDDVVGPDTLNRFGQGSSDARTVYVRNNKMNLDFEVVKSDGKYSHEVLGLQHSDDARFERMRNRQGQDE